MIMIGRDGLFSPFRLGDGLLFRKTSITTVLWPLESRISRVDVTKVSFACGGDVWAEWKVVQGMLNRFSSVHSALGGQQTEPAA